VSAVPALPEQTQPYTPAVDLAAAAGQQATDDVLAFPEVELQPAAAPAPADAQALDFDLGDLSLDLDSPAPAKASAIETDPEPKSKLDSSYADFELPEGPDSRFDEDGDPLERKIDLADEFRQIGDLEGARDLLEEVVAQADGALKTKAQNMLDSLG
jgi:pilus assembly protein FimV